ncbi:MAG: hypothetical protein CMK09_10145 [Ponticaulis sp.]|nr:hypothetical protein [Ponticaulis sp.]|tara:strand:- start:44375 stop:46081 length:1707 start_codon:yes stop_codon:yes gene_type:complete
MAARETHFELFLRKSPKASWVLVEAVPQRAAAIEHGKKLLKAHPHGGIRVMKEERKRDGSYESIMVITLGDCEQPRKKPSRTIIPHATSSCVSPSDLRETPARKTYIEVMPRFLERHRVLPGELIFRTDLLEMLEADGSEITQAIQRVAISRAEDNDLHSIARQLHEMVQQAINGVFKEKKSGVFVKWEGDLASIVRQCQKRPNFKLAFGSALSDRLMKETSWEKKLKGLITVWQETETLSDADQKLVNDCLSDYFVEWLGMPGAVKAILGETESLADMIDRLIALLEPRGKPAEGRDPLAKLPAARDLNSAVQQGMLPGATNTILSQIFEEISSNRRLYEKCLLTEFRMLKQFGDRLVKILQSSRRAEMYDAFCARSKRLMSTDTVDGYLEQFDILDRPRRLLELKDNLVGIDARQKMTSLVRGLLGQPRFEAEALNGQGNPVQILLTLRAIQLDLLSSDLPEQDRIHAAQDLDTLGVRAISGHNLFKAIAQKAKTPENAALALFRLAAEVMPRGQSAMLAGMAAQKMLKEPAALEVIRNNSELQATLRHMSEKARLAGELVPANAA